MLSSAIASRAVIVSILVAFVLTFPALAARGAAQPPYDAVVVFGDSLSDTGNVFAALHAHSTPPDYSLDVFLVPGAPYARGGHHFSNGAVWIEYLARPLGLAGSVRPAFQSASPSASNFAVATGRARNDGRNVNLGDQVQAFLARTGGVAPSGALYVIELGGNDVRDALVAFPSGGSAAILEAALTAIAENIQALYAAGARHFLVWNVPDISFTPAVQLADSQVPGTAFVASALTQAFNAQLALALNGLSLLPGIDLVPFDASGLITAIVADPSAFGLTDATSPCVMPGTPPFACQGFSGFLFWDGIHPTTAAHEIVARTVAALLGF